MCGTETAGVVQAVTRGGELWVWGSKEAVAEIFEDEVPSPLWSYAPAMPCPVEEEVPTKKKEKTPTSMGTILRAPMPCPVLCIVREGGLAYGS
eukprot:3754450-Rhodomonas_salina.2